MAKESENKDITLKQVRQMIRNRLKNRLKNRIRLKIRNEVRAQVREKINLKHSKQKKKLQEHFEEAENYWRSPERSSIFAAIQEEVGITAKIYNPFTEKFNYVMVHTDPEIGADFTTFDNAEFDGEGISAEIGSEFTTEVKFGATYINMMSRPKAGVAYLDEEGNVPYYAVQLRVEEVAFGDKISQQAISGDNTLDDGTPSFYAVGYMGTISYVMDEVVVSNYAMPFLAGVGGVIAPAATAGEVKVTLKVEFMQGDSMAGGSAQDSF